MDHSPKDPWKNGIFIYIWLYVCYMWLLSMVNVDKYASPMDPMGRNCSTISLLLRVYMMSMLLRPIWWDISKKLGELSRPSFFWPVRLRPNLRRSNVWSIYLQNWAVLGDKCRFFLIPYVECLGIPPKTSNPQKNMVLCFFFVNAPGKKTNHTLAQEDWVPIPIRIIGDKYEVEVSQRWFRGRSWGSSNSQGRKAAALTFCQFSGSGSRFSKSGPRLAGVIVWLPKGGTPNVWTIQPGCWHIGRKWGRVQFRWGSVGVGTDVL